MQRPPWQYEPQLHEQQLREEIRRCQDRLAVLIPQLRAQLRAVAWWLVPLGTVAGLCSWAAWFDFDKWTQTHTDIVLLLACVHVVVACSCAWWLGVLARRVAVAFRLVWMIERIAVRAAMELARQQ
jgi:hypothetical protein